MDRITLLKQHLQSNPGDPFLQHALALELIKIGDDEQARQCFVRLLEKDPAYVGSYYHLGKLLERTGEEKEAVAVYEKGMKEAEAAGERRALGELRAAWEELTL
jgi:tetratricopeptide (TPR) repeat protein